ncbi:alpha/beta fold hydrolase, partial [Streptomyces decoyicus]|uniref:alpha/beta fold hydrolase n=1 Tax=Streptomyces decoyicus TaxID=249567 RepID=UPI00349544AF
EIDNGIVPIDDGELFYETAGSGPAVVLLHGGPDSPAQRTGPPQAQRRAHRAAGGKRRPTTTAAKPKTWEDDRITA